MSDNDCYASGFNASNSVPMCCGLIGCTEAQGEKQVTYANQCMQQDEHMKMNKTSADQYCNYYCQTTGQTCFQDSDCARNGTNYCCGVLQHAYSLKILGP